MIPKSQFRANISRERLRQLRKNAAGLCLRASCNRKHVKWGQCKEHAKADSARRKASYAAKKKAAAK